MKNAILLLLLLTAASCITPNWQQQLQTAIYDGDADAVKSLLANHLEAAELNKALPLGKTPLALAVEREALHIAKLLLTHGADASQPGRQGVQPLHLATHPSMAALLLEHGASPTAVDELGNTPLHKAKNAAMAKFLLEKGADANARNQHGFTPIETGVIDGRVDVFDELAGNGVRLTTASLERLRRLGKREPAMAARLAEYRLPQSPVATNPTSPATFETNATKKTAAKPNANHGVQKPTPPAKQRKCSICKNQGFYVCTGCEDAGSELTWGLIGDREGWVERTCSRCGGSGKLKCHHNVVQMLE